MLTVTFRSVTDAGDDYEVGKVTWDGKRATPSHPKGFVADVANSLNAADDLEAAIRELPSMYKSAYLRAQVDK